MTQIKKLILILLGSIFLLLGTIGIFIPILPTTPFLLLAAACFLRSSKAIYRWLMTNRVLGKYIYQYRITKAIPFRAKLVALTMLWVGIFISAYIAPVLWVKLLLIVIASGVTHHILSRKTMTLEDKVQFEESYQLFLHNDILK